MLAYNPVPSHIEEICALAKARHTILKPLLLLKARINRSDYQKITEAMKLDDVQENEFNCLGSRNKINQKIGGVGKNMRIPSTGNADNSDRGPSYRLSLMCPSNANTIVCRAYIFINP